MIDYPDLEIRNEDQLAAEAIARVSGGLTEEIVRAQIREREEMLELLAAGLIVPVCPELTNANPSAPHTVLLEAFAWLLAHQPSAAVESDRLRQSVRHRAATGDGCRNDFAVYD